MRKGFFFYFSKIRYRNGEKGTALKLFLWMRSKDGRPNQVDIFPFYNQQSSTTKSGQVEIQSSEFEIILRG